MEISTRLQTFFLNIQMCINIFMFCLLLTEGGGDTSILWLFQFCWLLFPEAINQESLSQWSHLSPLLCPISLWSSFVFLLFFLLDTFNFMPDAHVLIFLWLMNPLPPLLKLFSFGQNCLIAFFVFFFSLPLRIHYY